MAAAVPGLEKGEGITLDLHEIPKTVLGDSCKASSVMRDLQFWGVYFGQEFPASEPFISLPHGKQLKSISHPWPELSMAITCTDLTHGATAHAGKCTGC